MDDKVIVTNRSALVAKYGECGPDQDQGRGRRADRGGRDARASRRAWCTSTTPTAMKKYEGRPSPKPEDVRAEQGRHRRDLQGAAIPST